MTWYEQHCETCRCYEPKITIVPDFNAPGGVRIELLNGAVMPKCAHCLCDIIELGRSEGILHIGDEMFHDNAYCRP